MVGRSLSRIAGAAALWLAALSGAAAQVPQLQRPAPLSTPVPGAIPAVPSHVVQTDNVRAELIADVATVKAGEPFWVGLRQTIRPKWHTYWRNPGDSGMPTEIKWALPANASASEINWPLPQRFRVGPIVNYGYEKDVLLPVRITPPANIRPGERLAIDAEASWLVCEEVCIPEEGRFRLTLPVGDSAAPHAANRPMFEATLRTVPIPSPWTAEFAALDDKRLAVIVKAPGLRREMLADVYFFPAEPGPVEHSGEQKLTVTADQIRLEIPRSLAVPQLPASLPGVLAIREIVAGRDQPVTQAFTLSAARGGGAALSVAAPMADDIGLWQALLFALLGGLILNLMPCVFPVLSMKALALARHAREDRAQLRNSGLAYTGGVLASFAAIGLAIAAMRSGGEFLGWGFQFQSPLFTLLIAWLFFVIGLNLSGVFEIGGRLAGIGSGLATRDGHIGSFFTGVLASVVATPCTAPFMAAAVGFALTQPTAVTLAVLLAMGLGLALPYLALTFSPGLLRHLPRPGSWMVRFKQVLAFPMYGSAAWLVWVLSQQAGSDGVLYALAGMVALGFGLFVWQAGRDSLSGLWRHVAAALLLLSLGSSALLAIAVEGQAAPVAGSPAPQPPAGAAWERFSRARLAELRAAGKPVFVNITAAWCITCLANERVALSTEATRKAFADGGVVYLKGDWTNRDPEITATLKEFGRAGVPLYLFYSGKAGEPPEVLPQILTEADLLGRVHKLRTAKAN